MDERPCSNEDSISIHQPGNSSIYQFTNSPIHQLLLPSHRLRPGAARARQAVEPGELVALARGVRQPAGALVGAREPEMQARALRRAFGSGRELGDRAVADAGLER